MGALALKPDEFRRLTPGEFYAMVKGYEWRAKSERHSKAWMIANMMNVWVKRRITINKLLGKGQYKEKSEREADSKILWRQEQMKRRKRALEKQKALTNGKRT